MVADTKNGLEVIDVSSPDNPAPLGSYDTEGYCLHAAVSGKLAYVVDAPTGFSIVDVSKPGSPLVVSVQQSLERPSMIAVTEAPPGHRIACIIARSGLDIYDLANQAAPVKLTTYKTPAGRDD